MLKLYHNPISPHSRRVLVALLEKNIECELVEIELNGVPNRPELLAINPLHHIPVLEDDGFRIIESLAILDYLEAKYPNPSLLPTNAQNLAKVRMVHCHDWFTN
ncbi:glutathione S-transferase family protein [Brunnivagina elsteri]|uniref:glutathione S-transferase family protein n=1 Tax=Brunnivagina elsteri TaxID=1247191 RepID=UPI001FE29549|nr:glutathione S-transferase family protein [Calothrix elsteri]